MPSKIPNFSLQKKIASFDFLDVNRQKHRQDYCSDLCIILLYWHLQEKKVKVPGLTFDQLRDNERKKDPFQSAPYAMKQ